MCLVRRSCLTSSVNYEVPKTLAAGSGSIVGCGAEAGNGVANWKIELQSAQRRGISWLAPPISRVSADRTYPGGLAGLGLHFSQPPEELD